MVAYIYIRLKITYLRAIANGISYSALLSIKHKEICHENQEHF